MISLINNTDIDSFLFNYVQNLILKLYPSEIIVVCIGMSNLNNQQVQAALHDARCHIIIFVIITILRYTGKLHVLSCLLIKENRTIQYNTQCKPLHH